MAEAITVFTPTYNRAYCLHKGYQALCRQSCKDFVWMIVDDGSTDNTQELVQGWIAAEKSFRIIYIKKENGGLHTGYNTAIAHAETPLCVCIDSDDYMPDDAIEKILTKWKADGGDHVAGIIGLDVYEDGRIIGDPLPGGKTLNILDLDTGKYPGHKRGDRKNVVRTELYKAVAPMPSFPGEKNFNPHYMHQQISLSYDFLVLNEALCVVEYQADGMSSGIFYQYRNSPRSFAELRKFSLRLKGTSLKYRMRNAIHYVSSSLISRNRHFLKEAPRKAEVILAIPFGVLLTAYVYYRTRK